MKTIQISESTAKKIYNGDPDALKSLVVDTYGKEFFSGKITDRIKTYEDACLELGMKPTSEKEFSTSGLAIDEINYRKLKTIIKALNEGWEPDWNDPNQKKWYPYFGLSGGGFVFCGTYCSYTLAIAGYGSRLCLKSNELAAFIGKQHIEVYKGFMI